MKTASLLCTLAIPAAATAQKLQATAPPTIYHVGSTQAPLYHTPADTASKTGFYLAPGAEATVVGEYSPRWAIVKREGFLYLAPTKRLIDYNSADLAAGRAADEAGLPVDPQTRRITYQGVVEVPDVDKATLYTRAHSWVATAYRSANAVIQMQDKEAGQLIVKGLTTVTVRSLGMNADAGAVRHTLTIYVKDGRYKYVLTSLTHDAIGAPNISSAGPLEQESGRLYSQGPGPKKQWADIKRQANQDAYRLITALQAAMTLKGAKDPSDF